VVRRAPHRLGHAPQGPVRHRHAGGQSGAAVYRIKDGKRYAVAIHAYGGATVDSGTRINGPVYDNITQWKGDHQ
jgi:hypothetical protein